MNPQPNTSEQDPTCVCTGIRWCAACKHPDVRKARKLHQPPPLPAPQQVHRFSRNNQETLRALGFSGVAVLHDFVSPEESTHLLQTIGETPFVPAQSGKEKQHFGPKINFKAAKLRLGNFSGIPDYAHRIHQRFADRIEENAALPEDTRRSFFPTDVFVLRYDPIRESNLDFHQDDTFAYGELILDVSLQSDSCMQFYRPLTESGPEMLVKVDMPARSCLALWGAARYEWKHAICAEDVVSPRISITLRTLSKKLRETPAGKQVWALAKQK